MTEIQIIVFIAIGFCAGYIVGHIMGLKRAVFNTDGVILVNEKDEKIGINCNCPLEDISKHSVMIFEVHRTGGEVKVEEYEPMDLTPTNTMEDKNE